MTSTQVLIHHELELMWRRDSVFKCRAKSLHGSLTTEIASTGLRSPSNLPSSVHFVRSEKRSNVVKLLCNCFRAL
jgi:hypothetical protein